MIHERPDEVEVQAPDDSARYLAALRSGVRSALALHKALDFGIVVGDGDRVEHLAADEIPQEWLESSPDVVSDEALAQPASGDSKRPRPGGERLRAAGE